MNPRPLAIAFALAVLAGSLVALPTAPALDATGRYGGTLQVGVLTNPEWDPSDATAWRDGNTVILDVLYDSLARPDPVTGLYVPWAANSWAYTEETVYNSTGVALYTWNNITVELRGDLRWSDNSVLDSADVVRSFQQYSNWDDPGKVRAVDADTVLFNLTAGGAGWFWLEALGAKIAWNDAGTLSFSGPFARDPSSTATNLVLTANLHYWNGRPFLDGIEYTAYGDVNTLACNMLLGSDRMDLTGVHLVPNNLYDERACGFPDQVNRSLINPNASMTQPWTRLQKAPGTKLLVAGFDWTDPIWGGASGQALRRAVYMMLNKQLYQQIEPNSVIAHALTPAANVGWYDPSQVYVSDPGFTGTGAAKRTNGDAAVKAVVDAGFFDRDGDGFREDTAGNDFTLNVAGPSFNLDARKAVIAGDMQAMLSTGFNGAGAGFDAVFLQNDTWAGLAGRHRIDSINLDVYDPASANLAWMFTHPDLLDANDADVDAHLNLAAGSTDWASVRLHMNHVMMYAGRNGVLLPLLTYDSLEVANTMNFEGWVSTVNGVNNFWSMISLGLPSLGPLEVTILPLDTSVTTGDRVDVQVLVTDSAGVSVTGATVEVLVGTGLVAAVDNGSQGDQTANDGIYAARLTVPTITSPMEWTFTATAYKPMYQSDSDSTSVAAYPDIGRLRITTSWLPLQVTGDDTATLTVTVQDAATLSAVPGADVGVELALPGGSIRPASGTTGANGEAVFTFEASVTQRTFFTVTVTASHDGYLTETRATSVSADPEPAAPASIKKTVSVPGLESVALLAIIGLLVAVVRVRRKPGK